MQDRQASRELAIFQAFAKAASMASGEADWEKRNPPEPDILYHSEDAEPIAYELVEIIDEEFAEQEIRHRSSERVIGLLRAPTRRP